MIDLFQHFFDAFGGKTPLLFLGSLYFIFLLLSASIKNNVLQVFLSLFASLLIVLELVSLFFTQQFISYSFFVHFNLRGIQGESWMFLPHYFFAIVILFLLYFSFFYSNRLLRLISLKRPHLFRHIKRLHIVLFFFILSVVLSFKSSFWEDKHVLFSMLFVEKQSFHETLEAIGMTTYRLPNEIEAEKGKNIIVLSLESLELGYLTEKYVHLTPHLNQLKKKWNFIEVEPTKGCGWTSASLYATITGFPAYFGVSGTRLFANVYETAITGITHVLKKANYETTYISGDSDHAGTIDMLNAFEFDRVIDYKNSRTTGFESNYGLRDKEIFEIALHQIQNYKLENQPFALFLSTIDTHFPKGIYDQRFESILPPQDTELEFMVSVLDYLIGEFITKLERLNLLENTSIYIFPDHLKMGDPSIFEHTGERKLYLISNTPLPKENRNIYQIDLPRIILDGAEVKHNTHFLSDYVAQDVNSFISKNIAQFTAINTSGIKKYRSSSILLEKTKNLHHYRSDTSRFIAHAGGLINDHIYTNSLEALDTSYAKGFRLFELDLTLSKDHQIIALHDWERWKTVTNSLASPPVSKSIFLNQPLYDSLTPLSMKEINYWFEQHPDAILITDKINSPYQMANTFIDPSRLRMEINHPDSLESALTFNLNGIMMGEMIVTKASSVTLKKWYEKGVKFAVVSRSFIHEHPSKTKFMKELGIKVFVHNPEYENDLDLDYMINYELDFVFGVYADDWPVTDRTLPAEK